MNKDNNTLSIDVLWDGLQFDIVIKKSESMTIYGMQKCGFQILEAKVNGSPLSIEDIPDGVTELLLDQFVSNN
jgi:hypothetical protein